MGQRPIRDRLKIFTLPLLGFGLGYLMGGLGGALQGLSIGIIPVLLIQANWWARNRNAESDDGSKTNVDDEPSDPNQERDE